MSTMSTLAQNSGNNRLLGYYGDDFTGSTDVLEALFRGGIRAALFLDPPNEELLGDGRFAGLQAIGVAGIGRSLGPAAAEAELRPVFAALKQAGAAVIHYKICSTFDSSPELGSIGNAAEVGRAVLGGGYIPIIAGVPYLGRYTLFGNHFAAAGGTEGIWRLDRHPTMSRHPATPMKEADLRLVLAEQTSLRAALMDIVKLSGSPAEVTQRLEQIVAAEQPELLLFDVLDEERLAMAGMLLWEEAARRETLFVIGSSGVEYALAAAWQAAGIAQQRKLSSERPVDALKPVEQLLVVSGSCSPVTQTQIDSAREAGFAAVRVPAAELVDEQLKAEAWRQLLKEAAGQLRAGRSVLLYSAAGPDDPAIAEFRAALAASGQQAADSSKALGGLLGALARELIKACGLTRLLVAGGDTSGYVTRELGIYALECAAALVPGAPLCRAYSHEPELDGLELILKGGQIGGPDFFTEVKEGGQTQHEHSGM
jgi:uncharacterized protein YgbK (DUF1537 family)